MRHGMGMSMNAPALRRGASPLVELTRVRLLEFFREPEAVFWVFVFPVLLAIALGIAFRSQGAAVVHVAVTGGGRDELAADLAGQQGLEVQALNEVEAGRKLAAGEVELTVRFARPPASGQPPQVVYRFDPERPEGRQARLVVDEALQRRLGRQDVVASSDEALVTAGSRYVDFLIPGLVGLNLMGSGMWGLGFAIVQARTRKLLKRFAATPMRRSDFLAAFALSRLLMLVAEVVVLLGAGWLLFGVTVRGRLLDLTVVALLGAVTFAGLGLAVAARARTIEAVSGWMNLIQLPMWLLSGSFFAYSRFPKVIQPFIRALPLTALNDALRAVMNRGVPLHSAWLELLVMVAWSVVSFAVAVRFFRWQ
jgi:ABC-2 type transport system permease protein